MKLRPVMHEKPWGRTTLPPTFGGTGGRRIGEIWFQSEHPLPLLAKYLFTGEKLSVQVHPDDEQARARGLPAGKTECWVILDAEPGASLALGLERECTGDEVRAAALDGSIERLVQWHPVAAGDTFLVPAGTIHAIGAGISLMELQQNEGTTFRLYDYGRPRELHLDDALDVAFLGPYPAALRGRTDGRAPALLVDDSHFCLVQISDGRFPGDDLLGRRRWILPLDGEAVAEDERAGPGECLVLEQGEELTRQIGRALVGAEGPYRP